MSLLIPPLRLDSDDLYRAVLTASTTTGFAFEALWSSREGAAPQIVRLGPSPAHSAGDRTQESFEFDTGGGFLYGLYTGVASGVKRGQLFVELQIGQKGRFYSLTKGYVTATHGLSMGEFSGSGPGGGEGVIRSIDLGDPTGGNEFAVQSVPTNARWRVLSFQAQFVASATGANRAPSIQYRDGSNLIVANPITRDIIVASENVTVSAYIGAGGNQADWTAATGGNFPLPDISIPEGYDLNFVTQALDGSDNWGDGQLLVEEWIEV